ncbi:MAG: lamin tail domain-containing protein, partial [Bacteroidetes bacterium]|nr:lamin tail domain-containing protein [Bacteroidota bacterium]
MLRNNITLHVGLFLAVFSIGITESFSQCAVVALVNRDSVCAGDTTQLDAVPPQGGGCIKITEAETQTDDFVEIQNVGTQTIDVNGWTLAVSDNYNDINIKNTIETTLSGTMAPGSILTWSDDFNDPDYWGNNIFWTSGSPGWIVLIDDDGIIVDYIAWHWTQAEILTQSITVNGYTITPATHWFTGGFNMSTAGAGSSAQRTGNQDMNDSTDWVGANISPDSLNNNMSVPFPFCSGDSLSNAAIYSWSPGTDLSDSTISNPVATVATTTTFIVTVNDT